MRRNVGNQSIKEVLKDYIAEYKVNKLQTLLAFGAPAIGTILVFYIPPLFIAKIVNAYAASINGNIAFTLSSVSTYLILLGALWFAGEVCWRFGLYFFNVLECRGMANLAQKSFTQLSSRDYNFYANNFVGSLTKKAGAYYRNFESFTDVLSMNIISGLVSFIFSFIILATYSLWIPLILVVAMTVVIIISVPLIKQRAKIVANRHDASSKMSGIISDSVTNMLAIKSYAQEKEEEKRYIAAVTTWKDYMFQAWQFQNFRMDTVISPIYVLTNVIGLIAAILVVNKFSLEVGTIVVIFSYFGNFTRTFWDFQRIYRNLESSITEAAEFTEMFITPPEVIDVPHAAELHVSSAGIEFNQVGFSYAGQMQKVHDKKENEGVTVQDVEVIHDEQLEKQEEDAQPLFIKNFNLKIKPNEKIGLVGPSGGGKTTITKLLLRFIDVSEGTISIDHQDISQVTQGSLRSAVGYVPQEPLLFHRTLRENIAYGKEDATMDEIIHAAKIAYAHEFISELPQGYETLVGERGVKLSGGQRQRIAIARALLKNAPILVLDEATSALDSESEKYIQAGFKELMKNKTAVVIAHRLSTIKDLDRIIVLDGGNIVQEGTHDELINKHGLYAKLWKHQSGGFLEE